MPGGEGSDMKVSDHGQLESKECDRERHEMRRNSPEASKGQELG